MEEEFLVNFNSSGDELLSNGDDAAAAGGGEEEEEHMMDSECTPLHNLELAFIFWEKDQQDWIWHQAASTKKAQVGPQSKCKGPKPRHKCKGEISTHPRASQMPRFCKLEGEDHRHLEN